MPLSMLRLMNDLDPDAIMFHTGAIAAGDVSGSADLGLLSNGFWSFKGSLHDKGKLYGDNYSLGIALHHADKSGNTIGFQQKDHIDHGDDDNFQQNGRSQWIEDNWAGLKKNDGWTWKLHSDPHADSGEVWAIVVEAIFAVVAVVGVVLWLHGESQGTCEWATDDHGSVLRQCNSN
jgi:hypothetical protein